MARLDFFPQAPELNEPFGDMYGALWTDGLLEQELKETVRLRNARITDCGL
jgi:hypothetical protein